MIWSPDLSAEFYLTTSPFDSLCMDGPAPGRTCLFGTVRTVDSSSICWLRTEPFYSHSTEMISFISTGFRGRRGVNGSGDEYAVLMRSDRSGNGGRRCLDQEKKTPVANGDLGPQVDLGGSGDGGSVDRWMGEIFYIISWISHPF
jgi:hypothetical protein